VEGERKDAEQKSVGGTLPLPSPPSRPHLAPVTATGGDPRGPNAAQCPIIRLTGLSCPRWGTMISPGDSGELGVLLSRSVFF